MALWVAVGCLTGCAGAPKPAAHPDTPLDLIIENGRVLDGTGNPWFLADVGVADGIIVAIGDLSRIDAGQRVDASGKIVAPGFIDIHTHADDASGRKYGIRADDVRRRRAVNILSQGVTTIAVNPDGAAETGMSIDEQRREIERGGVGPNVVLMAAHNAIRAAVMGSNARRAATPAEIDSMREKVRQAMEQGAFGLTSGLEYDSGRWSQTSELVELARELAPYGGVHISHMRSESSAPLWWVPSRDAANPPQLLDSIREIIEIAESTGTKGVISHIKVRGTTHWGQSPSAIDLVEAARRRGIEIYADQYPYSTSGSDGELVLIPPWARAAAQLKATLRDSRQSEALRLDIEQAIAFRGGAENITIFEYPDAALVGKSLLAVAQDRRVSPVDAAIALSLEGFPDRAGGARLRSFSIDEADMENLMSRSWVATSSDGGVALPEDGLTVHPRYTGSFTRKVSRYVRERKTLALEFAVRAGTSLPAQILGLHDRGVLRPGMAADIVVFDENAIQDNATFTAPHELSSGVDQVWVNGRAVVRDAAATGELAGKVLHRERTGPVKITRRSPLPRSERSSPP